jgi:hypothetical protein
MANAAQMVASGNDPLRILIGGFPGSAKTGSLASLLNAGYKVRLLDFEGNYEPLLKFVQPDKLANLDIKTFQDRMYDTGEGYIDADGIPDAFTNAMKTLKSGWKTTDAEGNEVDLGRMTEWGPDVVLAVDSMTAVARAAMARARKMMNKTPKNMTAAVWGSARDDLGNFVELLKRKSNKFHLVFIAHLQLVGPEIPMESSKEDSEIKDLKRDIALQRASLMDTRLYPIAVTRNQSTNIHSLFPVFLLAQRKVKGTTVSYSLTADAGEELDLKFPPSDIKSKFPIETGLADVFSLLGAKAPK